VKSCRAMQVVYHPVEESYIDDIPFNTTEVVLDFNNQNAMKLHFETTEEPYINDIPFNTSVISVQAKRLTVSF
jgi:hypothetical protein